MKAAGYNSGVNLNLFHPLVKNAHAAAVPPDPHLATDIFGRYFVKGASHFDITVAMHVAARFLVAGKKRIGKLLQMRAFVFEKCCYLFTRGAVDALVSNLAFPAGKIQILFTQRFESPSLQSIRAYISDRSLDFAFVLRLSRAAGYNMHPVMAAKVRHLG